MRTGSTAKRVSFPYQQSAQRKLREVKRLLGPAEYRELVEAMRDVLLPWLVRPSEARLSMHSTGCKTLALVWILNRAMLEQRNVLKLSKAYRADRCTLRHAISHVEKQLAETTKAHSQATREETDR